MDKDIYYNKVESLRKCIARIAAKTPNQPTELEKNIDLQDIICLNLERAVQTCVDIASLVIAESDEQAPETMRESFAILKKLQFISEDTAEKMQNAVSFRNIAVHNYQKIDWKIVFNIATQHIDDFKTFINELEQSTLITTRRSSRP